MAASQAFQPRELTEEQKVKLLEAELKVEKKEGEIDYWSNEVKKAAVGSEEEKKAKEQQALFREERDKAETQLKELKVEFGQVSGSEFIGTRWSLPQLLNPRKDGISKFILDQLLEETKQGAEQGPITKKLRQTGESRYLELVGRMNGLENGRKELYVRDCMPEMIDRIVTYLETPESSFKWMVLGGNRGCGNSVL
jgi:hypothetical protein